MHKANEDCFYFLTANCAKGMSCTYRHSPQALICNMICPAWTRGSCMDPACPLRHSSTLQRPPVNNNVLCFFENTPMGCLKLDCTFGHSRPRPGLRNAPTIRPTTMNLINKDAVKIASPTPPAVSTPPPPSPSASAMSQTPTVPVAAPAATNQVQALPLPSPKVEVSVPSEPSTTIKNDTKETVPRRVALPSESETNVNQPKSTTRSVITEVSPTNQSRVAVHRNVVIAESASAPTRKIVQATASSSNRVVVSSEAKSILNGKTKTMTNDSDSDIDLDDMIERESATKKFKHNSPSVHAPMIDIPFPCSAPSITNRVLLLTSKPSTTTTTNDTKPIRLNRHRLPAAAKPSSGNFSSSSVPTVSSEEKTSTGSTETKLTQEDDRRTSRLERFKKTPISPPRSIVCSSTTTTINTMTNNSTVSRNVVTSSPSERKRTANESTIIDSPPSKRVSSTSSLHQDHNVKQHHSTTIGDLCSPPNNRRPHNNNHHRHHSSSPRISPPRQMATSLHSPVASFSSSTATNESTWKKTVDEFIAKTTQPKYSPPMATIVQPPQPVPLLSLRPRFAPPSSGVRPRPIRPMTATAQPFRPRQPPSVVLKRPLTPVVAPSKPIEQILSKPVEIKVTPVVEKIVEPPPSSNVPSIEDENDLLELNAPSDVIDAFALIDEALLDTDDFLELM